MLESAIAPHLRTERTRPATTPAGYDPPFSAYSARFPEKTKDIVMAIFGAQGASLPANALDPLLAMARAPGAAAPRWWDVAAVRDAHGHDVHCLFCYWDARAEYAAWRADSGFENWWAKLDPASETHGWFKEVFLPPVDRFETVFSDDAVPEGAAHMRTGVSGPIQEHVYWGSARDRFAAAQTDGLAGDKWTPPPPSSVDLAATKARRVRVKPRKNLCVIRSGQDWSDTRPEERTLYVETTHPVLQRGMDFLRDEGAEVGCFSCRLMDVLDRDTLDGGTDKTFGLAYFDDLESLEEWSRAHQTHLDIFGRFLQYVKELNGDISLRLFHEVLVLEPEQQDFEYVGCHAMTGMLAAGPDAWES